MLFFKDGFGIKWPTKFDMPLNKETKPNQTKHMYVYLLDLHIKRFYINILFVYISYIQFISLFSHISHEIQSFWFNVQVEKYSQFSKPTISKDKKIS